MYTPFHGICDEGKLNDLIASMSANGWQGAPLVADGDQLVTGAHRWVAAREVEINAPVVDIRDIYPERDTLHAEYGTPTADERDYTDALIALPQALRDAYGIDAH